MSFPVAAGGDGEMFEGAYTAARWCSGRDWTKWHLLGVLGAVGRWPSMLCGLSFGPEVYDNPRAHLESIAVWLKVRRVSDPTPGAEHDRARGSLSKLGASETCRACLILAVGEGLA